MMNLHDQHDQNTTHDTMENATPSNDASETSAATPAETPAVPAPRVHLSSDDLEGLPEELMKELGLSESDRLEMLIVDLIERLGGVSSLNKILVEIYKETGAVEKRARISSRLNRMTKKGLIYPVPKTKGIYSTTPMTGLLGSDDEYDTDESDEDDIE